MHISNRHISTHSALAIGMLAVSGAAHAHYFCVANAQQFQDALTQCSDGGAFNGEDNDIFLIGGIYRTGTATDNGPFFFYSSNSAHTLQIAGGYAAGCSAGVPQTPATILDGGGNTGVLTLRNKFGNINVRQLTLQNGESAQPGAGLQLNYLINVNAGVGIATTIIRDNHSTADAGGLYASSAGQLSLNNSLITGNSADDNYGGAYLTGYGPISQIYNNTVTENLASTSSGPVGGMYCGGNTAEYDIFNNIFWNNNSVGIYLANPHVNLVFNAYGTRGGVMPATDTGNFVMVNPRFVDAAGSDFHLGGNSPLLGVSNAIRTFFDLDGNPYPHFGKIDLGAYEETIFIDGYGGD